MEIDWFLRTLRERVPEMGEGRELAEVLRVVPESMSHLDDRKQFHRSRIYASDRSKHVDYNLDDKLQQKHALFASVNGSCGRWDNPDVGEIFDSFGNPLVHILYVNRVTRINYNT